MPLYLIIILVVLGTLILFVLSLFIANKLILDNMYGRRGDGSISIKYPYPSNYPNLNVKKSYFLNNKKARLVAYEYVEENQNPKAVVLLIHGIGGGHFYLLPLINYLCENGYMVVAYDQYASGTSEGKKIVSMVQGAIDVKYAVRYLEANYPDQKLYVMGHSWGGFVSSQALRYSKRIEKCVDIAGMDSEAMMAKSYFKPGWFAYTMTCLASSLKFGKYSFYTTYGIFKKTTAKVLYLQGKQDNVVDPKNSGFYYEKKLKKRSNITIKMMDNKGHAPFVDFESQKRQSEVMKQFGMLAGVLVDLSVYVDYEKTSIPDMDVYKMILDYLDA